MRNYWRLTVALVFTFGLTLGFGRLASSSEITDGLKATIDGVIDVVKDENLKNDKKAQRAAMRKLIDPRFSYEQMSMRSLAENWKSISRDERQKFVDLFSKLLENSYASKLESYSNEVINYVDEKVKGKYALVKTEIVRKDGTIDVDYKLIRENGTWRIFDFVIEGVSMVKNYRSQFNRIIKKESYDVLKKKMTAKIEGIEGEDFKS